MCLEDIKIMAKSNGFEAAMPVATAAGEILSQSVDRIGIVFCPHNTDTYWVSTSNNVAVGRGIPIRNTDRAMCLSVFEHGDLCRRAWFGISVAGAITVSVIELHLDRALAEKADYGKA